VRVTFCALLLLAVAEAAAAPAPLLRREKAAYRWVEIDFSPLDALPAGKNYWYLWAALHYPDGASLGFSISGDSRSATSAAASFCSHAKSWSGWFAFRVSPCGKKVLSRSSRSYPLLCVELRLTGLPDSAKPKVRWLR
jgi:hypothetical protein